jgi:hypothetical protein
MEMTGPSFKVYETDLKIGIMKRELVRERE